MKQKVVVTGGTGFVGSNLIQKLLQQDYKVYAIVREKSNFPNIKEVDFFCYSGNLEDLINFFREIKPKIVFHLASKFIAEHKSSEVAELINSNVLFSTQILEAMKEAGIKKIVNTGTSWQYYNNKNIYNPVCLYAATKQAFESVLEYYIQAEGFQAITLLLFDTYGENDKRPKLINLLNKFADEGTVLDMSYGEQTLNLVHINDVCQAFIIAATRLLANEISKHERYAVGSNEIYTLREVVALFEKVSGKKVNIKWGTRNYRRREVMQVWQKGERLPSWKAEVSLQEGFFKMRHIDNE